MMVQWARQRAVTLEFMDSPARGVWRLTDAGHRWITDHPDATRLSDERTAHRGGKRVEQPRKRIRRSQYENFFSEAQAFLESRLPAAAQTMAPEFKRGNNWLEIRLARFGGCYYELWLARGAHVISIQFASSRRRNEERRQAFEPHLETLTAELGHPIRAEAWGEAGRTRVWLELDASALTESLAERYADLTARFMSATWPILESIYADESARRQKPQTDATSVEMTGLGEHHAILDREIQAIRAFLQGRTDHRPSDEKLCDWVQFCYTFELYAEGRDLFALVSGENTNSWYFERTRKVARICEMRARPDD
jgi:hypothetical protein